jgi:hypothetical protein
MLRYTADCAVGQTLEQRAESGGRRAVREEDGQARECQPGR